MERRRLTKPRDQDSNIGSNIHYLVPEKSFKFFRLWFPSLIHVPTYPLEIIHIPFTEHK